MSHLIFSSVSPFPNVENKRSECIFYLTGGIIFLEVRSPKLKMRTPRVPDYSLHFSYLKENSNFFSPRNCSIENKLRCHLIVKAVLSIFFCTRYNHFLILGYIFSLLILAHYKYLGIYSIYNAKEKRSLDVL